MESNNLDFMGICLDEVALEGLDGITMPSLWKRLEKHGKFPLPLDEPSKQFIWECILQHPDLEIYLLEEPRLPLVIYNRYSNVDLEMGIVMDADESAYEIYPHAPVQNNEVKGSCSTFDTRKKISGEPMGKDRVFFMAMQKYGGERVVVVASQEQRNRALLGTEVQPNLEFSLEQYCLLERIGRARYHGEVTMGRLSLSQMKIPSTKMFYIRKILLKLNLITKQIHLQRIGNATQHSSLLHLRRFYVERLSKVQVMVMKMCAILKEKPNNLELFHTLRAELGMKEGSFKKMFNKAFQVCVQARMIPYGEYYPDAPTEKRFALNGKERQVKVAVLVKNYEEPEEEDFEEEEEEKCNVRFSMDPRKMTFDRPILTQLYNEVEKAGPNGITSNSLRSDLGISKLEIRLLLRNLERRNSIFTVMLDIGRQRSAHYVAKCFEKDNLTQNQLLEMKQKLLSYNEEPVPNEDYQPEEEAIPKTAHVDVFNELDNVVVDYVEEEQTDFSTKSWNFSLKDISSALKAGKDKDSPNFTYKMLKRVNLVIDAVREHKLIEDPFRIQKLIFLAEQEEGLSERIDKKSTHRIISRLAKDGYIRSIKTRLTLGDRVKKLHFICHRSIKPDDQLVQSAIEQAKLKYFSVSKPATTCTAPLGLSDSGFELRNMSDMKDEKIKYEFVPSMGRSYGLLPKFLRMKSLHLFIFYLVYDYEGSPVPLAVQDENSPAIYHLSETWKRFVPPLPQHVGKSKGWCLISDAILSMPLSLLLKVVNYTYKIEGIEIYTHDHIKQHYLLRHLPQDIRNMLLHSRKYIFTVHEVLTKLAFMGLISFGPQQHKEKDQIFVYAHKNASIKDTSLSESGNTTITPDLNYVTTKYHLATFQDAENYWYELETVCMRTPLGASRNSTGVIKNIFHEPSMIEASRQKACDEIMDDGQTPGDGMGAAGLDSGMFAHLRRNWSWPAESGSLLKRFTGKRDPTFPAQVCSVGVSYMKYLAEKDEAASAVSDVAKTKRLSRLTGKNKLVLPEQQVHVVHDGAPNEISLNIKKSVVPNVVVKKGYKRKAAFTSEKPAKRAKKTEKKYKGRKKEKTRRPYYDEKDKIALNRMSKQRVCWSVQEDSFLLLCKVTSCFLDPHHKGVVIPFSIIREIMHNRFPTLSYNKTSRACQRRILFMMRNPTTVANVSVFLLEAKQDVELVRQFQGPKPIKRDEEAWTRMFTTVLNHLLEKFTLSLKDRCIQLTLPDNLEEFNNRYKVSVTGDIKNKYSSHSDPRNIVDIYCSVMFCFIMSSMHTIGDKNNWSYTLYRVYQQYPDSLLRSVVAKMKRDRLITKRKEMNLRTELTIPLSSLPHKLSVHFDMNLQTRYQSHIYERASHLFKLLTADHSLSEPQGIELSGHVEPGDTSLILSLNATGNIIFKIDVPDQVVIFDSGLSDDIKSKIQEKMKQYQKEDAQELSELEDKCPPGESSIDTTFEVASSKASRIALYMLRHELGISFADNLQHAQDYFLINTCGLRGILKLPELKKWFPLSPYRAQCAMDLQRKFLPVETQEPTSEVIHAAYIVQGFPENVAHDGVLLMMHILKTKEQGCSFEELYDFEMSGDCNLADHLKFLILNDFVLRVGVTCFRYVSLLHCKPWVLSSFKVPKEDRSKATEIATQQANEDIHDQRQAKRARTEPENEDLHEQRQAKEAQTEPANEKNQVEISEISELGEKKRKLEEESQTQCESSEIIPFIHPENVSTYFKDLNCKMSSWGESSFGPDNVVHNADNLFKFAIVLLRILSGENSCILITENKECLPPELLDILSSSGVLCHSLVECFEKYTLNDLLKELSTSDFVNNISNFLAALEESETVLSVRGLVHTVFSGIPNTSMGCNNDLLLLVTSLLNVILTRALNMLLKVYKFSIVLQSLKSLTSTIISLKDVFSKNSANYLKVWFERRITIPIENELSNLLLLSQVIVSDDQDISEGRQQNASQVQDQDTSQVRAQKVLSLETVQPDEIMEKTVNIAAAVQFCVDDLLRRVEDSEFAEVQNLKEWLVNTLLLKIENEELRDWLQTVLLEKLDSALEKEMLKDWLYENVIHQVENSFTSQYPFIEMWLNETILCKVSEQHELLEIREWIQEIIQKVSADDDHSRVEKFEFRMWLNDVLIKVEEQSQSANEVQLIKKWFTERVLSAVQTSNIPESANKSIFKIVCDVIKQVEKEETVNDVRGVLDQMIEDISSQEEQQDLRKWLHDKILVHIKEQSSVSEEIIHWFEESLLNVLEKRSPSDNVDMKEVQLWLEDELKKLVLGIDVHTNPSELHNWFEENVLNVLLHFDQGNSKCNPTDAAKQCLDHVIQQVIKEEDTVKLMNDVSTCLGNEVLDIVETTSDLIESSISNKALDGKGKKSVKEESTQAETDIRVCLSNDIIDVVETASDIVDKILPVNEGSGISEKHEIVQDCINSSLLDVLDVSTHLLNVIESKDSDIPDANNTKEKEFRKRSVLDAVNEMSEFVHSVNALIEVIDDGQTTPTSEHNMSFESENLSSATDLNENLLDAINATFNLVNSTAKVKENLDSSQEITEADNPQLRISTSQENSCADKRSSVTDDVGTCLQESVLDVVDTASSILDAVTKTSESSEITEVKRCLEDNVLDIIDTSTVLIGTSAAITDVVSEMMDGVVDGLCALQNDKTGACDISPMEIDEPGKLQVIKFSVTKEAETCLKESVLDVVDTTTEILDLVSKPSEVTNSAAESKMYTVASTSIQEAQVGIISSSSLSTLIDVVDVTAKLVESVPHYLVKTQKDLDDAAICTTSINNVLDIVEATSKLVELVHDSNEPRKPSDESVQDMVVTVDIPKSTVISPKEVIATKPMVQACDKDMDQEGKGKRKRKRIAPFETPPTSRLKNYETVRFVSRPWRKPDGQLNRKTLEKNLTAILGHIMGNPGINQTQLFERFEPTMQPVFILELVEMLTECECISTYYIKNSHSPGLFTETVEYNLLGSWEPGSLTHYEATPDAILKLSYFLSGFLHYRH